MSFAVPQHILDALTDVTMPRLNGEPEAADLMRVGGYDIPVFRSGSLVIGSGAAGLRAALK